MHTKYKPYYFSGILLALVIIMPLLLSHTASPATQTQETQKSQGFMPPSAPTSATYANEKIDLRRTDRRERMDRELMAFSYMHSSSMLMVKRANRYFPIIEPILKAAQVPDDLKYLMVIESSMNPFAVSPAGAAGFWQFMKGTGRDFGLEVNNNIDERYHIEKSTKAACQYLKGAYAKYGDWLTAAASYNAGQGRITGELKKQDVEHAADLWLVQETSRYMFRLLAAKQFLEAPKQFGFYLTREDLYPPLQYKEIVINKPIDDLVAFASQEGITYAELKEANPWLRARSLENKSGKSYTLLIPTQESLYYDPAKTPVHYRGWLAN